MTPRLLAIDLDGTLLRRDGVVDELDRLALAQLREAGVVVVVATGRLYSGARAVIEELELEGVQICADGAELVRHPAGGDVRVMGLGTVTPGMRRALDRQEIALFAMAGGRIIVDATSANLDRYIRHIAAEMEQAPHVLDHPCWSEPPGPTGLVAIGPRAAIEQAEPGVRTQDIELRRYDLPGGVGVSSLAISPKGASKGEALAAVAAELGIAMEATVAVGDWLNDVSMLRRAGRSFAMGHAPAEVVEAATDHLGGGRDDRGAIAELIEIVWG